MANQRRVSTLSRPYVSSSLSISKRYIHPRTGHQFAFSCSCSYLCPRRITLHCYTKISERLIQAYFLVGTLASLTNDQCAGHLIFSRSKGFRPRSGNDNASWRYVSSHHLFCIARNIDDRCRRGEDHVCANHSLASHMRTFDHNAT